MKGTTMTRYTLGLDLGSNSVGWAMIAVGGDTFQGGAPILAGVRVFPEGVDRAPTGAEQPRGQDRRVARGQRRMHYRRRQRRRKLMRILQEVGFLPKDNAALALVRALDPYALRASGLDRELAPFEFGRVLMHICQRRGFKSNRKTGKSKDDGKVAKETAALAEKVQAARSRTLGEYLAGIASNNCQSALDAERVRARYTLRTMYEHEFEELWKTQSPSHASALTDSVKQRIHEAIFFQRPLRYDLQTIGDCELEPGEKRCPKAHWLGQQFRMFQEINALRVLDPVHGERALNTEERAKLSDALVGKKKMTFDDIRRCLGLFESQHFNLEGAGRRDYLKGNDVEAGLRGRALKKWYEGLAAGTRTAVHDALAEIEDESELCRLAMEEWGCSEEQAAALLKIDLPEKYFNVSLKAINKMLPFLDPAHVCGDDCLRRFLAKDPDAGHVISEAKELAGYTIRRKEESLDSLPPLMQTLKYMTNPLVRRGLTEMRKVVNALVREHGKPLEIVVELARDMKRSREQREKAHMENAKRKKETDEIVGRIQTDFNILTPRRDDILKYRLWKECGGNSPYSGNSIPQSKLFTGEVHIDHILPYSRSLDDSYMNKVVCFVGENAEKGNQTPLEAYGSDPNRYEPILQRVAALPYPKRRRFSQKELDLDKFVQRQLNDTRYISREAVRYVGLLGCKVRCVKGETTAELRWQWQLNGLLGTADEEKNRSDHRHHAIDAIVIAFTTQGALQKLSTVKYNPAKPRFDPPWENFRDSVDSAVGAINVSFRPARKLAGRLHEETGLGPVKGKPDRFVHRVPLERLTIAQVGQIRDPVIRCIVETRCRERGVDLEGSAKIEKGVWDPTLKMPSGVPIKRVRIETVEKTAIPIRQVAGKVIKSYLPGGNHHVEIYQLPDGKWTGRCVSRFEVHHRLQEGQGIVGRRPLDAARFLMSFCINDMVQLTHRQTGEVTLYRVQKMSSGVPMMELRQHTAARIDDKAARFLVATWDKLRFMGAQKVLVDPVGRVFPCND